jgi:hypothetical protein
MLSKSEKIVVYKWFPSLSIFVVQAYSLIYKLRIESDFKKKIIFEGNISDYFSL